MKPCLKRATLLVAGTVLAASCAVAQQKEPERTGGPYVPTPQVVVDEMLRVANVGPQDTVFDLGSGDGRIVITAAKKFGARGVGVGQHEREVGAMRLDPARDTREPKPSGQLHACLAR